MRSTYLARLRDCPHVAMRIFGIGSGRLEVGSYQ